MHNKKQSRDQTQNPHKQREVHKTINESTTTEPLQPKPPLQQITKLNHKPNFEIISFK